MEEVVSVDGADAASMAATAVVVTAAAAGLAASYLLCRSPPKLSCPVELEDQSRQLPDGSRVSRLPLPQTASVTKVGEAQLLTRLYSDCGTVYQLLRRGQSVSNDGPCLGWRSCEEPGPYRWISYSRVLERARNFGAGLLASGLEPGQSSMVGVYAQNRVEWVLAEQACYCFSMISVALYDTLGAEAVAYIVDHSAICTVVVDSDQRAQLLLQRRAVCLTHIVHVGPLSEATRKSAEAAGLRLTPFEVVEAAGAADPSWEQQPPEPQHVATISYTSGTTGEPKGVVLTHAAIVANVSAVTAQMGPQLQLGPGDSMLSFLPLSHTLERMCEFAVLMQGGCVGFWRGDIRLLMDDLQTLQPTAIPAVPRIFNRVYDRVYRSVAPSRWRAMLLKGAMWSKSRQLDAGRVGSSGVWDRLVFAPVRRSLGGRLRFVVIGSAPISPPVLTFMRAALGCAVLEGYGQTECVCPCTVTLPGDHTAGHVGAPLPCSVIRLVDVPDLGYRAAEGAGEVCVRGPALFSGYYMDEARTREALDAEGWLHTGDIGQWQSNGTLRIIDRKKNMFKLSQGEYVAPERLEEVLSRAPLVSQVYVHGDSLQSCLVAIVVPEREPVRCWALAHGHWEDTPITELCASRELRNSVLQQLLHLSTRAGFKGFERVRDVFLHPEPLSMDNDMMTATMKIRRHAVAKRFRSQIDDMYAGLT